MADRKFPLTDVILGAGISAILLAGFFIGIGPLDSLELKLYDLRARMHATHQVGNDIVIVAVDDPSISQLGPWPWPRAYMGELIDQLSESEAKVIAVDVLYAGAEVNPGLEEVRKLHKQFVDSRNQLVYDTTPGAD